MAIVYLVRVLDLWSFRQCCNYLLISLVRRRCCVSSMVLANLWTWLYVYRLISLGNLLCISNIWRYVFHPQISCSRSLGS